MPDAFVESVIPLVGLPAVVVLLVWLYRLRKRHDRPSETGEPLSFLPDVHGEPIRVGDRVRWIGANRGTSVYEGEVISLHPAFEFDLGLLGAVKPRGDLDYEQSYVAVQSEGGLQAGFAIGSTERIDPRATASPWPRHGDGGSGTPSS